MRGQASSSQRTSPPVWPAIVPYWLSLPVIVVFVVVFIVPMIMTFFLSFNSYSSSAGIVSDFSFKNYVEVLSDSYFREIFLRTFFLAFVTTAICAIVGTIEACILVTLSARWRSICLLVILGPLLISVVVRTLGWTILLGANGILNKALISSGLLQTPIEFLFTRTGVVIALVHVFVPYMVIAVWASLQRMDHATVQAALSLGSSHTTAFMRVVLPQIAPGILSGCLIVFSLAASAFATPAIIGGRKIKVVATVIYDEFTATLDWPLGAAIAMVLLLCVLALATIWNRLFERKHSQAFG